MRKQTHSLRLASGGLERLIRLDDKRPDDGREYGIL